MWYSFYRTSNFRWIGSDKILRISLSNFWGLTSLFLTLLKICQFWLLISFICCLNPCPYILVFRSRTPSAAFRYGEQRPSPAPTLIPRSKTPAPHPPRPTKTYPHPSVLLSAAGQGRAISNGGIVGIHGSGNTIPRVTAAIIFPININLCLHTCHLCVISFTIIDVLCEGKLKLCTF